MLNLRTVFLASRTHYSRFLDPIVFVSNAPTYGSLWLLFLLSEAFQSFSYNWIGIRWEILWALALCRRIYPVERNSGGSSQTRKDSGEEAPKKRKQFQVVVVITVFFPKAFGRPSHFHLSHDEQFLELSRSSTLRCSFKTGLRKERCAVKSIKVESNKPSTRSVPPSARRVY